MQKGDRGLGNCSRVLLEVERPVCRREPSLVIRVGAEFRNRIRQPVLLVLAAAVGTKTRAVVVAAVLLIVLGAVCLVVISVGFILPIPVSLRVFSWMRGCKGSWAGRVQAAEHSSKFSATILLCHATLQPPECLDPALLRSEDMQDCGTGRAGWPSTSPRWPSPLSHT